MPRNVEIKARVRRPAELHRRAANLADGPPTLIRQRDTFYAAASGRLKLRDFGDGHGELIAYQRPDREGPKTSSYLIAPTGDPAALHAALAAALGVRGVVVKERTLLLSGRTRIHLDRVEGLGEFLELEVVVAADVMVGPGTAVNPILRDSPGFSVPRFQTTLLPLAVPPSVAFTKFVPPGMEELTATRVASPSPVFLTTNS